MARITLPISPTDGQTVTNDGRTLIWSEAKGKWRQSTSTTVAVANVQSDVNLEALTSNIIPAAANEYNLGSALRPFKDLFLSANTLNIGDASISSEGGSIQLPEDSQIGTFVKELSGDSPYPSGDYGDLTETAPPALNLLSSSEVSESSSTIFNCETTPTGLMAKINLGNIS